MNYQVWLYLTSKSGRVGAHKCKQVAHDASTTINASFTIYIMANEIDCRQQLSQWFGSAVTADAEVMKECDYHVWATPCYFAESS